MGLLQARATEVPVWPSTDGTDEFGATVRLPGDTSVVPAPATAKVWIVRPDSSTEASEGYDTTEQRRLVSRDFPFGAATVFEYEGRLWDVVDEPLPAKGVSLLGRNVSARVVARTGAAR